MLIPLIMRWVHILSAVIAIGGSFYTRVVLMPAAGATLEDEAHQRLREALKRRWRHVVHTSILLFLISGFYTYVAVTSGEHKGQALYHVLFGVKFLLALVVFTLAEMLVSSRPWSAAVRANAKPVLALLVTLAMVVILIAGYMKTMPKRESLPKFPDLEEILEE